MTTKTVQFDEKEVKKYLDSCIIYWRKERAKAQAEDNNINYQKAVCYTDCFQSVRISLFGKLLPIDII